jgi:hypothetical protein
MTPQDIYHAGQSPEEIAKLEKRAEKKKKLHLQYYKEKIQNYENNDVRNATLEQLIKTEQELILKKNKASIDYYYKNKERLDNKRKELYQQQKEQISKHTRVLTKCKKILKYEMIL